MGITRPIVVFTPVLTEEFAAIRAADLTPALSSARSIRAWGDSVDHPYHLAIDTGMCRAGVVWREAATLRDVVKEYPPAAAFTHFHSVELHTDATAIQEERFREALAALEIEIPFLHAECSAAIVRGNRGAWDAVRPGLFLYGVGSGAGAVAEPEPVVSLRARVVEIRWLEPGDTVSYDATYTATRRERIATVAVGYGDGYPRALSNRGTALINCARVPVRGLVTMDMTMFDVTDTPCEVGDVATLIGGDGGTVLTVEDVAAVAGMSPYELLTGLPIRLDRRCAETGGDT
jgi:alanine racemase